jgi:hypothetical protein
MTIVRMQDGPVWPFTVAGTTALVATIVAILSMLAVAMWR